MFKKRPFMYRLGARLFRWMRDCALYEFSKVNGTLFDASAFKGEWRSEEECKNENNDTEL